jgi:CspA family cold shock protein
MKLLFVIGFFFSSGAFAETGIVRSFSSEKGYGFIKIPDSVDLFVHISAVKAAGLTDLKTGDCISFEIVANLDGREAAEDLKIINCSELEVTCR